jgi:predicted transcriptional regulator
VPVKRITPDHLICLECDKHFSMLKRHLRTVNQLTPDQYRLKWHLPPSYPIVASNYTKTRSALAKKLGIGAQHKGEADGKKAWHLTSVTSSKLKPTTTPPIARAAEAAVERQFLR